MHVGRVTLATSLLVFGCAPAPAIQAPHYPPAPSRAADPAPSAFTVAPGVTRLTLPCAPNEAPLENGLDDDCDGRLDTATAPSHASLVVTLTHHSAVDLTLTLTPAKQPAGVASSLPPIAHAVLHACAGDAPFTLHTATLKDLPTGRYELALSHGPGCGTEATGTATASLWLQGRPIGTYGFAVPPHARTVLGTLDFP